MAGRETNTRDRKIDGERERERERDTETQISRGRDRVRFFPIKMDSPIVLSNQRLFRRMK